MGWMMLITKQQLLKVAPLCKKPDEWLVALNKWLPVYRVDTPKRLAAFMAQMTHESGDFNFVVENTNYTTPSRLVAVFPKHFPSLVDAQKYAGKPQAIANKVYANRYGNGNEASGDGFRYRGRGIIHLTFRNNYESAKIALAGSIGDIVSSPELASEPEAAVLIACWYWSTRKLNNLADGGDFEGITKGINGGLNGQADRVRRHKICQGVFK